ncbi:MAG TPA: universal stress protein [Polyangiaceae bacterium]|jgi:nucleotide-binding universal stress UspA family protein|nr:MAG: Universal stress protein family protein [Deltaproteobacteria bacterium ADurb.Bin207]HNS96851.1 universal stress protein [Polyangiaceae bacterium]HNZ20996.1 universal stress protein [Polyangiaceae bacterium]HOD23855.1 universal stress protein [Polyangiaceae bacterium]HOE48842.1 universal stress protein [Polyangiaceae bacterium]
MKTIVAAIDFSDTTTIVIDTAVQLAHALHAEIVLFHATPPSGTWLMAGLDGLTAAGMLHPVLWERQQQDILQQHLDNLITQVQKQGLTVRSHTTSAVQRNAICQALESLHPDFIVIGSHRHGSLYELLGPGICSRIVRRAPCPVVVVHSQPSASSSPAKHSNTNANA